MLKRKKGVCLALIASLSACCLSSCFFSDGWEDDYYTYDYEMYKDRIVSIDLIDYTPKNTQYRYSLGGMPQHIYEPFETERVAVVESLPQEELQGFLYELSVESLYMPRQEEMTANFTNPCGRAARISYQDGSFHTISYCEIVYQEDTYEDSLENIMFTYYDANGLIVDSRFGDSWYVFVMANYFDAKIYPLLSEVERVEVKK